MTLLAGLLSLLVITAATGFFVAQEFAFVAVDGSRLSAAAEAGDAGSRRVMSITRRLSFTLSGAQLGISATTLLVGYVAQPLLTDGLDDLLGGGGGILTVGAAGAVAAVVAFVLVNAVQMVYGELFPKNLAIARPDPLARTLAPATRGYLAVFGWLIRLFDAAAARLVRLFGIEPVEELGHAATPEEIGRIVRDSRASGDLPEDLSKLLDRTLDFDERTAEHAMIPRTDVVVVHAGERAGRIVELLKSGHSRFPVIGRGVDDVIGVACLRDLLDLPAARRAATPVEDIARPPLAVPSTLPLPALLAELGRARERFSRDQLACVVDEYGGLAGVITLEDVAEELVGEIADEHDRSAAIARRTDEGDWLLDGSTHIDELERTTGVALPEGDYQTVGGLILAELHRLPQAGDRVEVGLPRDPAAAGDAPHDSAVLVVESIIRRVPGTVRLRLLRAGQDGGRR
ncbi:MAG: DUF21 domain-containing protein [Streptosporangiales bacterium]|nr:DUF21 domain-containing protein [Streptosporangiales bacterium]